jgi:hypothetical protein
LIVGFVVILVWLQSSHRGKSLSSKVATRVRPEVAVKHSAFWRAVTRHRFFRFADWSAKQCRVQRHGVRECTAMSTATSRLFKAPTSLRTPKPASTPPLWVEPHFLLAQR